MTIRFHSANPSRSKRVMRALFFVKDAGKAGRTGLEIQQFTGSLDAGKELREARNHGYIIDCEYQHLTPEGRKVYRYFYRGRV